MSRCHLSLLYGWMMNQFVCLCCSLRTASLDGKCFLVDGCLPQIFVKLKSHPVDCGLSVTSLSTKKKFNTRKTIESRNHKFTWQLAEMLEGDIIEVWVARVSAGHWPQRFHWNSFSANKQTQHELKQWFGSFTPITARESGVDYKFRCIMSWKGQRELLLWIFFCCAVGPPGSSVKS